MLLADLRIMLSGLLFGAGAAFAYHEEMHLLNAPGIVLVLLSQVITSLRRNVVY